MAQTITVTIGRNVGDKPMSQGRWDEFTSQVRYAVSYAASLWAVSPYRGQWDGVHEEALILYGQIRIDANLPQLRTVLSTLATYFEQKAIGLSVGEGELIEGFNREGVRVSA